MKRSAIATLWLGVLLTSTTVIGAREGARAAQEAPQVTLIRDATVLTASHGKIERGDVLVRGGRIAAVGAEIPAPAGATVVDASGAYLTPGIIDCHSHIAVSGSVNEGSLAVTAMVGIEDVVDAEDIAIYRELAGGVTTANVLHGSANPIGGRNQVIKLRWGQPADALRFAGAPPGIKFALGENPKRSGSTGGGRYPATRMGVMDVIRDAFNRARAYRNDWKQYSERVSRGVRAIAPRRDLELDTLVDVLEGRRLVHCHCYRADEILAFLRLCEEFEVKVATLQHVLEGYKVADEIARHGAGASTFSDWWAYKIEAYDAIPYNATVMTRRGVVVSINSDSAEEARHLNMEAAKAIKYGGLSEEEALRLVTLNPAVQLGIDRRVGSIDVGKDADLVLYNSHPFASDALPQKVWIDGKVAFDRAEDLKRREQLAARKKSLLDEEARSAPMGGGQPREGAAEPRGPGAGGTREDGAHQHEADGGPVGATPAPRGRAGTFLIRGATVHTAAKPAPPGTSVLLRDGKILEVGMNLSAPAGATVIDGKGLHVYPGLIDASTTMGLTEIDSIQETVDTTDLQELRPHLRAYDAIHPASDHVAVTRVNGVTTAVSLPQGGILAGQAAAIHLDGWTVEEMALKRSVGFAANIPAPSTRGAFDTATFSFRQITLAEGRRAADQRLKGLTQLLDDARQYLKAVEAARAGGSTPAPKLDVRLAALTPLIQGEIPLLANANTRSEIRAAVEYARIQKLKVVIVGGAESAAMAGFLKDAGAAVLYGPLLSLPSREDDPYDVRFATPAILTRAGVKCAIVSGDTANSRNLPFDAGVASGSGLSREEALKAVTLWPAEILGIADQVGSLEIGKVGNLVVTDGDLLDPRTHVKHLFIQGQKVSLESRHTRLWKQYERR